MILVAFAHGLRASEVVALTAGDVEDGCVTVKRLKGSQRTRQPLLSHREPLLDEARALPEYLRGKHGKQRLFPISRQYFWKLMQRYAAQAGIPRAKAHPHALKHTIAMQIIHSAGIEHTRQWLGHKSMSSTGEYLKVTDEQAGASVQRALKARRV